MNLTRQNRKLKPLYTKKEKFENVIIGLIQIIYISGFITMLVIAISNVI